MHVRMLNSETEGDDARKGDGEEEKLAVPEDGKGKAGMAAARGVGSGDGGGNKGPRVRCSDNVRA